MNIFKVLDVLLLLDQFFPSYVTSKKITIVEGGSYMAELGNRHMFAKECNTIELYVF